jgi:hypothetical protein
LLIVAPGNKGWIGSRFADARRKPMVISMRVWTNSIGLYRQQLSLRFPIYLLGFVETA